MNKKKLIRKIALIIAIVWGIKFILSTTGIFRVVKSATIANLPNIKLNQYDFTTSIIKPKRGDFMLYKRNDSIFGEMECIHRVCGVEGDLIEIKSGILFVNDKPFNENLNLSYSYSVSKKILEELSYNMSDEELSLVERVNDSITIVYIENKLAKKHNLKRNITDKFKVNYNVQKSYNKKWNLDNLGPIKVPSGKYFVLGDNRNYTIDSRTEGFVNKNNFIGTIIK